MTLYAITESYQWYKGADATHWGVHKTFEGAKKHLREIIEEKFDYIKDMFCNESEDEDEKEFNKWIDTRFTDAEQTMWEDEDDDAVTKFYIEETEVEE